MSEMHITIYMNLKTTKPVLLNMINIWRSMGVMYVVFILNDSSLLLSFFIVVWLHIGSFLDKFFIMRYLA